MSQRRLVSIVVLTHGEGPYVADTVQSVLSTDYSPLEIIVVDNEASANTKQLIQTLPKDVKVVETGKNLGFAGGNNRGIEVATGDIIVLLNDDTRVEPNWISALVEQFQARPKAGICGGLLLSWDGATIQHAGGIVLPNGLTWHIGQGEPLEGQYSDVRETEYVTGAVFAIHRKVLERLGLLEPTYFPLYFEEVEYCRQARKIGFEVLYVPKAIVYHRVMETSGQFSRRYFCRYHTNRLRFLLRNFTFHELLRAAVHEVMWICSGKNRDQYIPLFQAYWKTLLNLLPILRGRRTLATIQPDS